MNEIRVTPVAGVGEIRPGDDVGALVVEAAGSAAFGNEDVLVVAQKVVSKAEGRIAQARVRLDAALSEARRVLRRRGDMVIAETAHGLVCANSGVDSSNVEPGRVVLLPVDPDLSARRIRARVAHLTGADIGVIVSDTFGRPWRRGQTNVAIGLAGFDPFIDYRGARDRFGNELVATQICVADELAAAAELVMGKTDGVCAAIVRGARVRWGRGSAAAVVRPPAEDLFR